MIKKKSFLRVLIPWLIVLLALAALVWFVFVPIYSQKDTSISEPPVVHQYAGDKGNVVLENEYLLFEMDRSTTQFSVTDKRTGKVWYSNPQDIQNDKIAMSVNKEFLSSTLNVTYTSAGGVVEMNNYANSIVNQNYEVTEGDGSVRIDYAIGKIEREYLIPTAITADRYKEFTDQMKKSTKKKVSGYYTLYEPDKLDKKDNKDEIIAMYPSVTEQALYILKSDTNSGNKEKVEGYFAEVGYTREDYELDRQLIAGSRNNNGPVFNASVIYRLDGEDFVVEVPYADFRFPADYPLTYVGVLPMFGAAGMDQDGFMLIPEGGGAIIRYNNGKLSQNSYYANLYGWDYATIRTEVVSETENAFPVFGMSQEDGSFICMVEGGSSYCGINADIAGRYNSYNYVYGKFNVIHYDKFNVSNRTTQQMYMYESKLPEEVLTQRYRFIAGSSYVDMANAYGEYLRKNPDMRSDTASEDMPIHIELVGAINKKVPKLGVPVESVVATTTFSQAEGIMDEIQAAGIKDLHVRMTGWSNRGVRQRVLTSVGVVGELGGDSGMKKLIAYAKDHGVGLSFDGISCFAYDSGIFQGFLPFMHAARFTTREQVELFNYNIITYQEEDWSDSYYLVRPSYAKRCADNLLKSLRDKGADGVAFRDIGNLLSADYYSREIVTREQVKGMNTEVLRQAVADGLKVTIKEGNDYAVPYADLITDMNLTGNSYAIIDQRVPFYQIALHGSKNYTGEPINLAGDYQTALLECAEYGAGLNFTFMKEDTTILQDTAYSCYTSASFDRWKDHLLPIIIRYQADMKGLNRSRITNHEELAPDVTATTYSDGTVVYVNYTKNDYQADGVTVPARDYLVERRGE